VSFPRPTRADVLANLPLGVADARPELPPAEGIGVQAALERALLPALQRAPCLASFSGGRDSSAVLAAAVRTARRRGLPDPIPVIMRYPAAPATEERGWQELVLAHLGVREVEVIELRHELDALGPIAMGVLRRLGPHWPGNAHMHVPLLERAAGGSLLTGVGGDELFGTRAARHVLVARRQVRPARADLRGLARAVLPRRIRANLWRPSPGTRQPWLSEAGAALVRRELGREEAAWPHRWDRSVGRWYRTRAFEALIGVPAAIASEWDARIVNPLLDPSVLAELAVEGGATGFESRAAAMRRLFGDLLPDQVLARQGKAVFSGVIWGPATRDFAARWSGAGVEERYVDGAVLRAQWLSQEPDFRTILLLHAAWLHDQGTDSSLSSS
jgi:asparagine synthase (glutamine-hydrolysing)